MTRVRKYLPTVVLMLVAVFLSAGLASAGNLDAPRNDSPPSQAGITEGAAAQERLAGGAPGSVKTSAGGSVSVERRGVVLSCSVVRWSRGRKPVLTLECPGSRQADAVRVYIKLSWMEPSDRPDIYHDIVAPEGTSVMFRSNDDGAFVWLTLRPVGGDKAWSTWVSFNELVGLEVHSKDSSKE